MHSALSSYINKFMAQLLSPSVLPTSRSAAAGGVALNCTLGETLTLRLSAGCCVLIKDFNNQGLQVLQYHKSSSMWNCPISILASYSE
jgi:hypothetical protein